MKTHSGNKDDEILGYDKNLFRPGKVVEYNDNLYQILRVNNDASLVLYRIDPDGVGTYIQTVPIEKVISYNT